MIGRRLAALVIVALGIFAPLPSGWAQPAGKVVRIGYLGPSTPELERHLVEAFRRRLLDLGYMDGRNLTIVSRWAEGHDDRLAALAAELVRLSPDVIVVTGTPGILAAKQATSTIPIVMTSSGDPVRSGLVASLAHPGGNVTGVTILGPELEGKRLELLKQVDSRVARIGVFWNSANPATLPFYHHLPRLGGFRKPRPDSPNTGWRNLSFRGYADYMATDAFAAGLAELLELAREAPTGIACTEAVPWRCHRSLVADALVVRGIEVRHLIGPGSTRPHALTPFARVEGERPTYPDPDALL